jgi:hypothetical protein
VTSILDYAANLVRYPNDARLVAIWTGAGAKEEKIRT